MGVPKDSEQGKERRYWKTYYMYIAWERGYTQRANAISISVIYGLAAMTTQEETSKLIPTTTYLFNNKPAVLRHHSCYHHNMNKARHLTA